MDENVSPKTNALLWWIVVIIQSEVLDSQPPLPVAGMTEALDFRGKIEALDHYAKPLMLYFSWPEDKASPSFEDRRVMHELNSAPRGWIDVDEVAWPAVDPSAERTMLQNPEWNEIISYIRTIADKWLPIISPGPINAILHLKSALITPNRNPPRCFSLRAFTPPDLQPPSWSELEETRRREYVDPNHRGYKVMYTITEQYTTDPIVDEGYPARVGTNPTLKGAYGLAKQTLEEWGTAWITDEAVRGDGSVMVRAVYLDEAGKENDVKGLAWVEEV